jgi:hypothetical protein
VVDRREAAPPEYAVNSCSEWTHLVALLEGQPAGLLTMFE